MDDKNKDKVEQQTSTDDMSKYPSDVFCDIVYNEYNKIYEEYLSLYNKTFATLGVISAIFVGLCGFLYHDGVFCSFKSSIMVLLCQCLFCLFSAIVLCLFICKGMKVGLLNLEKFRDNWFKTVDEKKAKQWLVDVLLKRIGDVEKVRAKKQQYFDWIIICLFGGLIFFCLAFILHIGGLCNGEKYF
mgnify:CR=1 FL=1